MGGRGAAGESVIDRSVRTFQLGNVVLPGAKGHLKDGLVVNIEQLTPEGRDARRLLKTENRI